MELGTHTDERGNILNLRSVSSGGINFQGQNNVVSVGENTRLLAHIEIYGDNNVVDIGGWSVILGVISFINVSNARVSIGEGTTIGSDSSIQLHECSEVEIGQGCMISSNVFITVSDMHPIYDLSTGERVNAAAPVRLGRNIWVGFRTYISKGADVGDGTVIGACSVVSGVIRGGVIAAGVPARVLRENVRWERDFVTRQ